MKEEDKQEELMPEEAQEEPAGTLEEESAEAELEETSGEETAQKTVEAEETPAPAEEEEAKLPEKKRKEEEEEIVEERTYTIPLGKALIRPPKKRAPRAMHMIRAFIAKHMKLTMRVEEEEEKELPTLVISKEVNEKVWGRGIEKPQGKFECAPLKTKMATSRFI